MALIDEQPTSLGIDDDEHNFEEHHKYIQELNPQVVEGWSVMEVCQLFLRPLGLKHLQQTFVDHKVTGHVLLTLDKNDLREMHIHAVGDRVYIDRSLVDLKKHARKIERERTLWEGELPAGPLQYYQGFCHMLRYKCCGCCFVKIHLKVTAQGFRQRTNAPSCNFFCLSMTNDFNDFRFLKDVNSRIEPCCLCFRHKREIELEFDSTEVPNTDKTPGCFIEPPIKVVMAYGNKKIMIAHPEMTEELVTIIKNAWSESRLVAD